jgi:hypothetical protein
MQQRLLSQAGMSELQERLSGGGRVAGVRGN